MEAILLPILLVLGLILIVVLWAWVGPIFAFVVFALLCTFGAGYLERRRRASRGLPPS